MKKNRLLVLAAASAFVAGTAHAQYAAPRPESTVQTNWEVDAGMGYLFATNVDGADDGFTGHVAGYYRNAVDTTRETMLKYGVEFLHAEATGTLGGADVSLDSNLVFANIGVDYRFSRNFGAGLIGGVGMGGFKGEQGAFSDSTTAFGYQVRPELNAYINEHVGVSLAYRFFQGFPLDSAWNTNPVQHAVELSVKVRF